MLTRVYLIYETFLFYNKLINGIFLNVFLVALTLRTTWEDFDFEYSVMFSRLLERGPLQMYL